MQERHSRRWWTAALLLIVIVACVRVASTLHLFSETLDEPVHIAAGYDWHAHGSYTFDPSHPPLARILFGTVAARIDGLREPAAYDFVGRGNALLYTGNHYRHNLAGARLGNLPFLALAIVATALWARRYLGDGIALVAAAIFSSLPPILAHSGLATTDMSIAATLPLALLALDLWLDTPSWRRSLLLGFACGLALTSKFSFFVFFPVASLAMLACRWPLARHPPATGEAGDDVAHEREAATLRRRWHAAVARAPLVIVVALFVVWSVYRFSIGPLPMSAAAHTSAGRVLAAMPFPAPEFAAGVNTVRQHDANGHLAYLFGRLSTSGWWYYFPVALFYKSPLPFLLLLVVGIAVLLRGARRTRNLRPLMFVASPLAMLLAVMPASINIGIRHILPLYPPLAIVAACGAAALWRWRGRAGRTVVALLLLWLFGGVALAHPDYLPWFNEAAAGHPERILADSNLDWGQDVLRLARVTRERHITRLTMLYFGSAELARHGITASRLEPYANCGGWVAVSETALALTPDRFAYAWLDEHQWVRVGKSIRLYHIDDRATR